MKKFVLLCTTAMLPSAVYAQSAGSVEFENKTIIITGTKQRAVGGVVTPQTPKAKIVLNQDIISRQNPGQTILDTINLVPGVSFQNNDPYGSAGGTLTIRGFSSDRISLTFDGIQLNDSGNYAIYSNQQLDPELIEQVNARIWQPVGSNGEATQVPPTPPSSPAQPCSLRRAAPMPPWPTRTAARRRRSRLRVGGASAGRSRCRPAR